MKRLLIILAPSLAWAQSTTLQEVEKRFPPIERFSEARHVNTAIYEYPNRPVSLSYIQTSPIVQKALHPDAPIQRLEDFKYTSNNQRILVNVHERPDEKGFFYIVEKDGAIRRRVHLQFAEPIDQVTAMYEPPANYVEVTKPKNLNPDDPKTGYLSQLFLRLGQTNSQWTADLLEDNTAAQSIATTVGTNLMFAWSESFRLGATAQYEASSHRFAGGTASYKNPSLGLVIQTPPSYWGGGPWRFGAQLRTGPFGVLQLPDNNGRPSTVKIRTTTLQLDWQYESTNSWGEWSVGVAFQRDYPKLRRQENAARLDSSAGTNDQIGLFISQGFMW